MSIVKKGDKTYVYPIDEYCIYKGEIYVENDNVYSCTLNQTDIESNKNKFYIIQIIKNSSKYIYYTRYGRISDSGVPSHKEYMTPASAVSAFEKQFKSKTGNNWNARNNFIKKEGKYFMAEITYSINEKIPDIPQVDIKSKLDDRTQYLMKLLSNIDTMNRALIELDIDPKKMPLGKISNDQLDKAKDILKSISVIIDKNKIINTNNSTILSLSSDDKDLVKLSSSFYTYIPYSCGRKKPPVIDCKEKLDNVNNMIDELKNLAVAVKITNDIKNNSNKHACDIVYDGLNTQINPVDKTSNLWKYLCDYVHNTHAPTHNYKTEILDIYQIARQGEIDRYDKYNKDILNKTLLWHGSRLTNFCSIMQQGLLLNPSNLGVYITGKMFGYGVYFSDTFSKSFNYCAPETSDNIGVLLLCEVALGETLIKLQSDSYLGPKDMEKNKTHSTWGQGQKTPGEDKIVNNVRIPNGKLIDSKKKSVLLYNEYIVYNTDQIKQSYLVVVKKK